jgi:hypothetical protein
MVKFVKGQVSDPPDVPHVKHTHMANFVEAYNRVAERADRSCEDCGRMFLAAPHLRLGVVNPHDNWFVARNLKMLCITCCTKREGALGPTAASITGITQAAVSTRDGGRCVYTGRVLAKNKRTFVPVVDTPDVTEPNHWACSSKESAKDRGPLSHEAYLRVCAARAFDLWAYLREEVEKLDDGGDEDDYV